MKVVLVEPGPGREIADTGQVVAYGGEVEVSEELGVRLVEQEDVWARPTTNAAKAAIKAAAKQDGDAAEDTEGEA